MAPDSFKGTFSAMEVAEAIGRGLEHGGYVPDLCPVADGGEGTLEALATALGAVRHATTVSDPLGRAVRGEYALSADTGMVETASASGLELISPDERDPMAASTFGTGELIVAAVAAGARRIYLGVGGSATTDGGTGAVEAITAAGGLDGAELVVLCDVRTPFEDAARVFGPQKGADPDAVELLSERLQAQAQVFPRDPRGVPMTGAAGGLAGGLWAAFNAELVPGAAFVLDAVGFDRRADGARAVISGEGRLDSQTLAGKVVAEVSARAARAGAPCYAVVGSSARESGEPIGLPLVEVIVASTLAEIQAAGKRLADLI